MSHCLTCIIQAGDLLCCWDPRCWQPHGAATLQPGRRTPTRHAAELPIPAGPCSRLTAEGKRRQRHARSLPVIRRAALAWAGPCRCVSSCSICWDNSAISAAGQRAVVDCLWAGQVRQQSRQLACHLSDSLHAWQVLHMQAEQRLGVQALMHLRSHDL